MDIITTKSQGWDGGSKEQLSRRCVMYMY
jgi:hypothetical protein